MRSKKQTRDNFIVLPRKMEIAMSAQTRFNEQTSIKKDDCVDDLKGTYFLRHAFFGVPFRLHARLFFDRAFRE